MAEQSGATSRFEEESHHGWSPDIGSEGDTAAEAGAKAWETPPKEPDAGGADAGGEAPRTEGGGLSDTDMEPESPFGAGDSHTKRGEEIADANAEEPEGYKGQSQRPYGTSDAADASGVDPQNPRDPESPNMPPGDQGG